MANRFGKGELTDEALEELELLRVFIHTPEQAETIDALVEHRNAVDAAAALKITRPRLSERLRNLKRSARRRGFDPRFDMTEAAPEGFSVKGVSSYYTLDPETGEKILKGQWVKTKQEEEEKLALLMDALEPLGDRVRDKSTFIEPPMIINDDILCIYPMGDPHIGMHAWAAETGNRNFNLKLAERNLIYAARHLVDLAPPAKQALIINLGDFFHADNKMSTTTKGTPVHVDGRLPKVLETGVNIMVEMIESALAKHESVQVFNLLGNHDDLMSVVLSVVLRHHFNNNPRVTVEVDPRQHHYFEFGECLFGMHHGHTSKPQDLPGVMAVDRAEAWGRTKHRHFYCGHVHHDNVKEYRGCMVETFRTMAPPDAWHAGAGYRSGNDMKLDVWHKRYGHLTRHVVGIARVLDDVGTEDD